MKHEAGGTSILYVSDIPLDFLGFQADPGQSPLPDLTEVWFVHIWIFSPGLAWPQVSSYGFTSLYAWVT